MLTLTFLGVGSAFAKRNFQSNALLEVWNAGPDRQGAPDDLLLIDFGTTGAAALHALKEVVGFSYLGQNGVADYLRLPRLLVTHLHSDHIGGLEEFAFMHRYQAEAGGTPDRRPQLVAAEDILRDLWDQSLRGGLGVMFGRRMGLDDYFAPQCVGAGTDPPAGLELQCGYQVRLFRTDHIQVSRKYDWPSYGVLLIEPGTGRSVMYSGDTRFDPEGLGPMMSEASRIFHDVQLHEHDCKVHATLADLQTLPPEVRRKMVLYHYGDTWDSEAFDPVWTAFAGFAQPQRRYVLFE